LVYLSVALFLVLEQTFGDAGTFPSGISLYPETFFVGHRLSFNMTLFITGVFGVAAGASPNAIALCAFAALWSIGVGGNYPVDSATFLGMPAVTTGPSCFTSYGDAFQNFCLLHTNIY
jgi:hypothetical protein